MGFSGNLETMPLPDLLQWAANGKRTGTIRIAGGDTTKNIYIRKGVIVSCTSTDPREFLGHFLVSQGAIGEADLQRAITDPDQKQGLLGQILVRQGAITQEKLTEMLRLKAEESIFDLFTWDRGDFSFLDGDLPSYDMVPISLDVTGLVLEGMRRLDEWERIIELIPSPLCVPVAMTSLADAADSAEGADDPGRRSVLVAVDDDRSIEDICLHTHSSEFYVCDILFHAVRKGLVKMVRPRVVSRDGETANATGGDALVAEAVDKLESGDLERAVRFLQAAGSLEPANRKLRERIVAVETQVRERLTTGGVAVGSVPVLLTSLDEMSKIDLSPNEGFILSRIDGRSTVDAIIKISPLVEIDALLVVWKLLEGGHIKLTGT